MIKGVSKQIIEINNTDDEVFEKVVFYIKPDFANLPEKITEKRAKAYLKDMINEKKPKLSTKWSFSGWKI
jgi:hypothetical protein